MTTRGQRFWRWAVVLELMLVALGALFLQNAQTIIDGHNVYVARGTPEAFAADLLALVTGVPALVAMFALMFSVPMLGLVEVAAFFARRRARRRDEQDYLRLLAAEEFRRRYVGRD